ncbi:tetratricopeptide repeat protein [Alcaligenaceae bacterium SJ-26]|nr:tetratricopeptide repeat protein [Alcaligenaceae bacterium SJ-26]
MTTPAQRRYEQVVAARSAAQADPDGSMEGASAYEMQLARLATDKRRLHDIQSIERKIEVKRELLPGYDTWVSGVLSDGRGAQDDVLVTVMVWHIDVGNFDEALRIAHYVLRHGLALPDQYQRNAATVLVDEITDAALVVQKDPAGRFPLQLLQETQTLTDAHDMPDQARAKLHRALGAEYQAAGDLRAALQHYQRALALNPKAGVKRYITELEAALKSAG